MDNFIRQEDRRDDPCVSTTYDTTYNTTYETLHPNNSLPNYNIQNNALAPFSRYNEYGERRDFVKRFFARVVGANYIPSLESESASTENLPYCIHGLNRHYPNYITEPTSYIISNTNSYSNRQLIDQNEESSDDENDIIQSNHINNSNTIINDSNYNNQVINIINDSNFDNPPLSIFDKNYFLYIPRTPDGLSEEPVKNHNNDPVTQTKINRYLREIQYRNLCLTYSIIKDQYQLLLYRQNINNSSTIPIQFYSIDLNNCMTFRSMVESLLDLNRSYEILYNNNLDPHNLNNPNCNKSKKSFILNCIDVLINDEEFFTVTLCKLLLLVDKYDNEFYQEQTIKFKDLSVMTNIKFIDIIEIIFNEYPLPSQFRKILNNEDEYHFQFENLEREHIFMVKKLPVEFERRDLDEILFWYYIRNNFKFIDELTKFLNDIIEKNINFFHRKNVKYDVLLEQFCELKIDVGILYCVRKIISPDNISNSKAIFANVLYYFKYKTSRFSLVSNGSKKDLSNYLTAVKNIKYFDDKEIQNDQSDEECIIYGRNDVCHHHEQIKNGIPRNLSHRELKILRTQSSYIELSTSDDENVSK